MKTNVHSLTFLATSPSGTEAILAQELRELGAATIRPGQSGVTFSGSLETAYRVCLWSRIANRVLLPISRFPATTPEDLYEGIGRISWAEHVSPAGTIAVDFTTRDSGVTHSHYGALKVKDAIVDQFRDTVGLRPSVDTETPTLRVNVSMFRNRVRVSIDLSGTSLHRRGYRQQGAPAPLKENLAAAILVLAAWPSVAREGGSLVDPMCGSGTFLIEAALVAGDIAPGIMRPYWGFAGWAQHEETTWTTLLAEAQQRRQEGRERIPSIRGFDASREAVAMARENVAFAGLEDAISLERRSLAEQVPSQQNAPGLIVVNPPYGQRLGDEDSLFRVYEELGSLVADHFRTWRCGVFTCNPELARALGLPPARVETLYNGPLACTLSLFEPSAAADSDPSRHPTEPGAPGEMLANRIRKNMKRLRAWASRGAVTCYRIYDADIPEFSFAVDRYETGDRSGSKVHAHIQEYDPPKTVAPAKAELHRQQALAVIPRVLDIPRSSTHFKTRRRQRGASQYERLGTEGAFLEVVEGGLRFLVNLSDYLDTGLFLDHRDTRAMIRDRARGTSFLNLFGYTGTATVYAAAGGARETITVDMSNTYLDWARRNMELNGFTGKAHSFVRADCLAWVRQRAADTRPKRYDLIFLDPPTFSTSKSMESTLDILRDHGELIGSASRLLRPNGILIFSTNARRFKLDEGALKDFFIEDISSTTIPPDFARNPRIHRCWIIRPAGSGKA